MAVSCGPGMPGPYRAAMGKRDLAVSFGGVRAPRPTHGFSSEVVGRPALWPPWPFAAAGSCGPGMPGPYRAAMGKRDMAVSFGGVRAPRPTHGFSSGVVGRPALRKNKKTRRPLPRLVFFKKKEKNRTSRRRLNTNGTTPLQVIPSLRIRQGALVFFLFTFV